MGGGGRRVDDLWCGVGCGGRMHNSGGKTKPIAKLTHGRGCTRKRKKGRGEFRGRDSRTISHILEKRGGWLVRYSVLYPSQPKIDPKCIAKYYHDHYIWLRSNVVFFTCGRRPGVLLPSMRNESPEVLRFISAGSCRGKLEKVLAPLLLRWSSCGKRTTGIGIPIRGWWPIPAEDSSRRRAGKLDLNIVKKAASRIVEYYELDYCPLTNSLLAPVSGGKVQVGYVCKWLDPIIQNKTRPSL